MKPKKNPWILKISQINYLTLTLITKKVHKEKLNLGRKEWTFIGSKIDTRTECASPFFLIWLKTLILIKNISRSNLYMRIGKRSLDSRIWMTLRGIRSKRGWNSSRIFNSNRIWINLMTYIKRCKILWLMMKKWKFF